MQLLSCSTEVCMVNIIGIRFLAANAEKEADLAEPMDPGDAGNAADGTEEAAPAAEPPLLFLDQGPSSEAQGALPTSPSAAPEGTAEVSSLVASIAAAHPETQQQEAALARGQQGDSTDQQYAAKNSAGYPATAQNRSPVAWWARNFAARSAAPVASTSLGVTQQPTGTAIQARTAPEPMSQNTARPEKRQNGAHESSRSAALQIPSRQSTAEQLNTTSIPVSPLSSSVAFTVTSPVARSLSPRSLALYKYWKSIASQNEALPSNPFRSPVPAPQPSLPAGSGSSDLEMAKATPQSGTPLATIGLSLLSTVPRNHATSASSALPAAASPGIPDTSRTVAPPSFSSPSPAANLSALAQRPQVPPVRCFKV